MFMLFPWLGILEYLIIMAIFAFLSEKLDIILTISKAIWTTKVKIHIFVFTNYTRFQVFDYISKHCLTWLSELFNRTIFILEQFEIPRKP